MRHHALTKFYGRKNKIEKFLRKVHNLELDIAAMRQAQKNLCEKYPEIAEDIKAEDFV